ncbi:uncharacterized protein LOC128556027 [Mercenaria mercenaria]|uniref:uncharacterized protein LOC128556027 n=1 Tax=Mercenaria mercenaria TaxID=6596 RepID=UPI00234E422F|nr:uncharacterized protein LOC128556027 [Mercenaria mercenaria]XP_053395901.1 uncharacterized protein LOC128556027 [Mercenaria mercenaria]
MHRNDKIPLGFTLKCGVRVSQDKTGRATKMVSSPDYFAGIKVLNPRVDLPKDNTSRVNFQVTVPVGCRYNSHPQNPACDMGLNMFDPNGYTCGRANVVQVKDSRRCGLDITGIKEGEVWDYKKVYTFDVSTVDINYSDESEFTLQLKASSDFGHKWWNEYQPDNIKVAVTNNKVYEKKLCYAHVDPHMQTADGYNYECQDKGEYLMYRNTKYNIEILMKTDTCNHGYAQCICSLIIRAGADVFSINSCHSPRFLDFLSCDDGGILKVQRKNDRHYQVLYYIYVVFYISNFYKSVYRLET